MKFCSQCGAPREGKFCSGCGTAFVEFCPNCGVARDGNFCAGCGFSFEQNKLNTPVAGGEVWLPDPADPKSERLWNGVSWTGQTRPVLSADDEKRAATAILKNLKYGKNFSKAENCQNCGKLLKRSKTCSDCYSNDV
jgi:hypothetical protein